MNWTNLLQYLFSLSVNQQSFTSFATLSRKCVAKNNTALEASPFWMSLTGSALFLVSLLLPTCRPSDKASLLAGSWNPATRLRLRAPSLTSFHSPPSLFVPCHGVCWSGRITSWCSCRWWGWGTACHRVGWGLCICHVTFSQLVEGVEELQDVWVVKTTWGGTNVKKMKTTENKQLWFRGGPIGTISKVFLFFFFFLHSIDLYRKEQQTIPLVESKNSCSLPGVPSSSSYSWACRIISRRSNSLTSRASGLLWLSYSYKMTCMCKYFQKSSIILE